MTNKFKCWKKVRTTDNKRLYKKGRTEVEIQFTKIVGMGYRSCVNNKCRYFNTKPQALSFAHQYMKKHDKC